jgi:predicted nuclease with RNAse H fold
VSVVWVGIDIGGPNKGFHMAAVDAAGLVAGPERVIAVEDVVSLVGQLEPAVVALDSPRSYALPGATRRASERLFADRKICGIRWTPNEERVVAAQQAGSSYYEWIVNGARLYEALDAAAGSWEVIECFPTASWSVWAGPRSGRRAAWTRRGLEALAISNLPTRRLNQDDRDAIAAALTARLYAEGGTETFGNELVVPTRRPSLGIESRVAFIPPIRAARRAS